MSSTFSFQEILYILFGVSALAASFYSIWFSQKKNIGDDRERLVRIETLLGKVVSDVSDIKGDVKATNNTLSDHDRRISKLEESLLAMAEKCDLSREHLEKMMGLYKIGGSDD